MKKNLPKDRIKNNESGIMHKKHNSFFILHNSSQKGALTLIIGFLVLILLGLVAFAGYSAKKEADTKGNMTAQALPSPTIPQLDYEDCNDPYNYDCREEEEGDDVNPEDLMGPD